MAEREFELGSSNLVKKIVPGTTASAGGPNGIRMFENTNSHVTVDDRSKD